MGEVPSDPGGPTPLHPGAAGAPPIATTENTEDTEGH